MAAAIQKVETHWLTGKGSSLQKGLSNILNKRRSRWLWRPYWVNPIQQKKGESRYLSLANFSKPLVLNGPRKDQCCYCFPGNLEYLTRIHNTEERHWLTPVGFFFFKSINVTSNSFLFCPKLSFPCLRSPTPGQDTWITMCCAATELCNHLYRACNETREVWDSKRNFA